MATQIRDLDSGLPSLPTGWRMVPLRELGRWGSGGTPKAGTSEYYGGDIPWYKIGDLTDGYVWSSQNTITTAGLRNSSAKVIPPGTLLVAMYGSIGKLGITTREAATNQAIAFCQPDESRVLLRYLFYFLLFRRGHLMSLGKGGTQQNISQTVLLAELAPIPPIDLQRLIVRRIDDLFADVHDGEEELRRAQKELETYRKSLLKAAITGELTAKWRSTTPLNETAEQLLKRILDERRARWCAEAKNNGKRYAEPLSAVGDFSFELPVGWSRASLGQVARVVTGATPPSSRPECFGETAPFFTPGDLDEPLVTTARRSLSAAGLGVVRPVPADSILVTCIGATIGKLAMTGVAGATNQQINALVPVVSGLGGWIHTWLRSPFGQHEITDRASSTTMPILNKGDFARIPIPLPPIQEIAEIEAELEAVWAASGELLDDLARPAAAAGQLRQSILSAAFRGELVQ